MDVHQEINNDFKFIWEQIDLFEVTKRTYKELGKFNNQNNSSIDLALFNKAEKLIKDCYPKLKKIEKSIGTKDTLLYLSSELTIITINIIIKTINSVERKRADYFLTKQKNNLNFYYENFEYTGLKLTLKNVILVSVELINILLSLSIYNERKEGFEIIKNEIWNIAKQIGISTLSRKEKKQKELIRQREVLQELMNNQSSNKIQQAELTLKSIKSWHFLRSKGKRKKQIAEQLKIIDDLKVKNERLKKTQKRKQKQIIFKLESELEEL